MQFSTENWKRPQAEIDAIMTLLRDYLKESLADFEKENIRTRFIGDRRPLAPIFRSSWPVPRHLRPIRRV